MKNKDFDLNYEEDHVIDVHNLHQENNKQMDLAYRYGKHHTYLKKVAEQAHEAVKTKRSELVIEANANPQECCGKQKPNAGDIEAYYRTDKTYKKLKNAWIDAVEEADIAGIAYQEIAFTRKNSLNNLITQFGQKYFSDPNVPKKFDDLSNTSPKATISKKENDIKCPHDFKFGIDWDEWELCDIPTCGNYYECQKANEEIDE